MTSPDPAWWIFCLCVIGVSEVSYLWLLRTTRGGANRKLFARQVESLAAAGFVMNAGHLPVVWLQIWRLPASWHGALDFWYCGIGMPIMLVARYVCILQETHISFTFFVQSARWRATLPYVNRAIPFLWAAGLPLGLLDATLCPRSLSPDGDTILPACPDHVSPGVFMLCLLTSALSYFELLRSSWSSAPGSVTRRNIHRAIMYPTIAVLSYLPIVFLLFHHRLFFNPPWFFPLALILELSNGFLNAMAYAVQTKPWARGDLDDSATLRRGTEAGDSFHVQFHHDDDSFLEFAPATWELAASPENPAFWIYEPFNGMPMDIRETAQIDGKRSKHMLVPGEPLTVDQQNRGRDGVMYLHLADGRGWVFANNARGELLCVQVPPPQSTVEMGEGPTSSVELGSQGPTSSVELGSQGECEDGVQEPPPQT